MIRSQSAPYLLLRNGIYYFRSPLPSALQQRFRVSEYKVSLRTSERPKALWLSRLLRCKLEWTLSTPQHKSMAWKDIKQLLDAEHTRLTGLIREFHNQHGPLLDGAHPEDLLDILPPDLQAIAAPADISDPLIRERLIQRLSHELINRLNIENPTDQQLVFQSGQRFYPQVYHDWVNYDTNQLKFGQTPTPLVDSPTPETLTEPVSTFFARYQDEKQSPNTYR